MQGTLLYIVVMVGVAIVDLVIKPAGLEGLRDLQPSINNYSIITRSALFLTGTFLENMFYRGYLIERLISLTGSHLLAGSMSWAAFTFVHLGFFGPGPTLEVGVISAVLVLLYIRERNIWPCVVLHGVNDLFAYLLMPIFFG